jgi:hypothetical protein
VHRIGQTHDVFVFNFCQQGTVEEQLLRVLHDKINMFELVVGEMDAILGTLDDSRDFAEIVMELWISGRESGHAARINTYYHDLLRQIEKRIARHKGDAAASAKERSRAAATELDRTAKLDDLAAKYALKIRIGPGDVLTAPLPVRELSVRVIRKKAERVTKLHWNAALGKLESPWCERCCAPARPLFLCDDKVHFLCKNCLAPCDLCGRPFCRACQKKCKCGRAG